MTMRALAHQEVPNGASVCPSQLAEASQTRAEADNVPCSLGITPERQVSWLDVTRRTQCWPVRSTDRQLEMPSARPCNR